MAPIDTALFNLGKLDDLAARQSPLHRLDPRAKVLTTLVFIITVASFGKYQVSALLPFLLFPLWQIGVASLPLGYLIRRILWVTPFILFIAILNPVLDREILLHAGPLPVSGGWLSLASIMLRFVLTIGAALILIATTSFPGVCRALGQLGAPRIFIVQLLFLYRYIFVLIEEGLRMARARALRSFGKKGLEWRVYALMAGQLLMRSLQRAERIHQAMRCRGFDGQLPSLHQGRFGSRELLFTLGWSASFILLRVWNLPEWMGGLLMELWS
ncbi:cobalt ECF transporter T component CbiQ [Desulfuromonas sp. AOP6]|uniref:cobalt ECF transporter T component CbiQ n=1 Tax=Desulfuromonas sp. AOP6 TaxID=1566351 RepID=UPI0012851DE3|nr:cobalt ECF transporter T component CbiQ [Desulfuromonas sp. AOP6]BCA80666.1 cobalt ECF transporter T component CbiQ [Desulfuromonas sp. AOP6]